MKIIIDGYELGDWQENEWAIYRYLDYDANVEFYDYQFVVILKLPPPSPKTAPNTYWITYRDNYMKLFNKNKLYYSLDEAKAECDLQIQKYLKLKAFI